VNKLTETSRKILKAIYCGAGATITALSLTGCPPIINGGGGWAAYGMPPDIVREEIHITGKVVSKNTGEAIFGIVFHIPGVTSQYNPLATWPNGSFSFFAPIRENYTIIFTDVDGDANGGRFKQKTIHLTREEAEALKETPLVIELELETNN